MTSGLIIGFWTTIQLSQNDPLYSVTRYRHNTGISIVGWKQDCWHLRLFQWYCYNIHRLLLHILPFLLQKKLILPIIDKNICCRKEAARCSASCLHSFYILKWCGYPMVKKIRRYVYSYWHDPRRWKNRRFHVPQPTFLFPLPLRLSRNMLHGWKDNSMLAKPLAVPIYLQ